MATHEAVQAAYARYLVSELAHLPPLAVDRRTPAREEWHAYAARARSGIREALGFPAAPPAGDVPFEVRGHVAGVGYRIEKIVYESEADPRSRVPALLYLPDPEPAGPAPAIVVGCGHGGSKSTFYNQYACQMYARLGCIVLLPDPIGEEERHESGGIGLRGHRREHTMDRALLAGRPFVGKLVYDLVRAIDLLRARSDVDPMRIGCAGHSLGGTVTQLLTAVDDRLSLCLNSAWAADYRAFDGTVGCCFRVHRLMQFANQAELIALGAPHCAHLVLVGAIDDICEPRRTAEIVEGARRVYALYGAGDRCRLEIDPEGGHRPYHISPVALEWLCRHFGLDDARARAIRRLPLLRLGDYADQQGIAIEPLYNVPRHDRGGVTLDIRAVVRPPEALRVLSEEERRHGPFSLEPWLSAIEEDLPRLSAPGEELQAWLADREALRGRLRALLGSGPEALRWEAGHEIGAGQCSAAADARSGDHARADALDGEPTPQANTDAGASAPPPPSEGHVRAGEDPLPAVADSGAGERPRPSGADAGSPGSLLPPQSVALPGNAQCRPGGLQSPICNLQSSEHPLGVRGFAAWLLAPEGGCRSGKGIVYLPASRTRSGADPHLVAAWLAAGDVVVVLDAVRLNDNEMLLGHSATAFNVRVVRCAVDGLLARGDVLSILCWGEVDDVAAWAIALDERIGAAEIRSRGGVEPSTVQRGRHEGVVPGSARLVDAAGLWAMAAPRPLRLAPGIATPEEEARLAALQALLG